MRGRVAELELPRDDPERGGHDQLVRPAADRAREERVAAGEGVGLPRGAGQEDDRVRAEAGGTARAPARRSGAPRVGRAPRPSSRAWGSGPSRESSARRTRTACRAGARRRRTSRRGGSGRRAGPGAGRRGRSGGRARARGRGRAGCGGRGRPRRTRGRSRARSRARRRETRPRAGGSGPGPSRGPARYSRRGRTRVQASRAAFDGRAAAGAYQGASGGSRSFSATRNLT